MPRYIDADALYKETEKKIKANNEYGRAVVDGEFLDLINDAFTEDVAPRAKVARKIFEDIEKALNLSKCYGDSGIYFECDIENDIAELKKKYTEDGK